MPTYEYRCESCGHTFETYQSIHDAPLSECERCGGALRKVYAPVGIVFKGSGFYKTDSRSTSTASARSDGPKPEGSTADRATSDGTKGESKVPSDATATKDAAPKDATAKPAAPSPAAGSTPA